MFTFLVALSADGIAKMRLFRVLGKDSEENGFRGISEWGKWGI